MLSQGPNTANFSLIGDQFKHKELHILLAFRIYSDFLQRCSERGAQSFIESVLSLPLLNSNQLLILSRESWRQARGKCPVSSAILQAGEQALVEKLTLQRHVNAP